MTIKEIKSGLSILTVLSHYGLSVNRNGMMQCPFHDDRESSMRVYTETNTVYCFAGGCQVSNLDVIDFVMRMDGSTKHEAIKKAKVLLGEQGEVQLLELGDKPAPVAVLPSFNAYLKAFAAHKKSQEYCSSRALSWSSLEIGYKSRKTADKWGRACIIFALRNQSGEVVSLYGRSIFGQGHYYQAGRCGLYPAYPAVSTKVLVLTESVIDAATLLSLDLGVGVLALYGTNGLGAEHRAAIAALTELEEVILAMDGDAAGEAATELVASELKTLQVGCVVSSLGLADGEDVNSLAVKAADAQAYFEQLLAQREVVPLKTEAAPPRQVTKLDSTNPYDLSYRTELASYRIKGGLRSGLRDLDSLKVTLVVESEGRKSRQKLDLYEDKQVLRVSRAVAERLGLRADLLEIELGQLTDLLESYREEQRQSQVSSGNKPIAVSASLRKDCESFLEAKHLLKRINALIGQAGVAGEEMNRLLLFVVASSYGMPATLHALIQGASGSGKTRLLRVISELMPEESVKRYTRVTDGSFYNQGEYYFTNKLLCFEDIDGLKEDALLAVRELQSNEILITSTSFKDEQGGIRGGERIVRGPIASISCTTRAEVYEDNISRCFVVAVDESQQQSLRIIRYQNEKSAGVINGAKEREARQFLQNCLRLLQPLEVVNPYANKIHLPQDAHKIRRLNELYQSFVRQLTLLHQYQRKRDQQGRLIASVEDLQAACDILFESIVLKVDELDGSLRQFFEQLKGYVQTKGKDYEFNRFEVRQATGVSKTQQHRYINQLLALEYLRQYGFANRGYRYKIAQWDDIAALRSQLKNHLNKQLACLESVG